MLNSRGQLLVTTGLAAYVNFIADFFDIFLTVIVHPETARLSLRTKQLTPTIICFDIVDPMAQ